MTPTLGAALLAALDEHERDCLCCRSASLREHELRDEIKRLERELQGMWMRWHGERRSRQSIEARARIKSAVARAMCGGGLDVVEVAS